MAPPEPATDAPIVERPCGFTFLELLIAITALGMLVALLMAMLQGAITLWRSSENRADSFREARAALSVITSDLSSAVVITNTNYFRIDGVRLPASAAAPPTANSVFFLTALSKDAQDPNRARSEICSVGYFLAYDQAGPGSASRPTYNLYRYFRNSDDTFERGIRNGQLFDDLATGPTGEELLARNITSFQVKAYAFIADSTGNLLNIGKFQQSQQTPVPNILEITLRVLNNETASKLDDRNDWGNTNSALHLRNRARFNARIRLRHSSSD